MLRTKFSKPIQFCFITLALSGIALAQYPGGGGSTGTSGGTYSPAGRSYGHGALIGAAVGGGVGGTVLFLALRHHHHNKEVVGCVGPDGKTLNADSGKATYKLSGTPMTAGEHLSVIGKKIKGDAGADELQVFAVKKDLGQCGSQTATLQPIH